MVLGAVQTWLSALFHPDAEHAGSAGVATAIALGFGFFALWTLLRVA
jgi:hypothetical protein